jgi:hypothetical protein
MSEKDPSQRSPGETFLKAIGAIALGVLALSFLGHHGGNTLHGPK